MSSTSAPLYQEKNRIGAMREFFRDPLDFSVRHSAKYGPLFEVPLPLRKIFVLTGKEEIRQVLQSNHRHYHKSPFYNALKLALGNGLLSSEGDYWKQQRRLMQPVFYKSALDGLYQAMLRETRHFCEELDQRIEKEVTFDLSKEMMRITANVVLQSLFGTETSLGRDDMYRMMVSVQEYVMMRALRPYLFPLAWIKGDHRRFKQDKKLIDDSIYEIIDQRMLDENPPHDLLSLLIHSKDEQTGEGMSREAIRDELVTLFAAGHETSANALTWTIRLLADHPEKLKKLRAEADQVLQSGFPKMEDLFRMPYTKAVIEEGMRLYPPAYAVGRTAIEEDEISGYTIPEKSIVFLSIYGLHRNPEYWPNPNTFQPERFLPDAPEIPKHAYLPFGFGPRKCIGFQFAMMEMQLILPVLLQRFDLKFHSPMPEKQILVTLRPKGGMPVEVSKRVLI